MKGQVALVTGGGSGIGRATAIEFAKRGAHVAITGRRESELQETARLIKQATGAETLVIKGDISKEADCKHMVAETVRKFGGLHMAFNNAGIEGEFAPVHEQTVENFHQVMDVNVLGVLLSMKYEVPAILAAGGGAIVNNSSIAGLVGMPQGTVYVASKHAVIGLTKSAALELAPLGVRVNAVSPAAVETPMFSRLTNDDAEARSSMNEQHPLGRVGQPAEIAQAVVFLCSPEASFMTGVAVPIDGGWSAQ